MHHANHNARRIADQVKGLVYQTQRNQDTIDYPRILQKNHPRERTQQKAYPERHKKRDHQKAKQLPVCVAHRVRVDIPEQYAENRDESRGPERKSDDLQENWRTPDQQILSEQTALKALDQNKEKRVQEAADQKHQGRKDQDVVRVQADR